MSKKLMQAAANPESFAVSAQPDLSLLNNDVPSPSEVTLLMNKELEEPAASSSSPPRSPPPAPPKSPPPSSPPPRVAEEEEPRPPPEQPEYYQPTAEDETCSCDDATGMCNDDGCYAPDRGADCNDGSPPSRNLCPSDCSPCAGGSSSKSSRPNQGGYAVAVTAVLSSALVLVAGERLYSRYLNKKDKLERASRAEFELEAPGGAVQKEPSFKMPRKKSDPTGTPVV